MSLFDRGVVLQLKLEVAQTADTGLDLLARAARIFEMLSESADYLEGATRVRQEMNIADRPPIDVKAVTQAVAAFRAGLSRHGSAAFQHQPASTLTEAAKTQRDRCSRWLASRWRQEFAPYETEMDRAASEHLTGSGLHSVVAQARASKLRALRGLDPITQHEDISKALETSDVARWRAAITALGDQLAAALGALDAEHAALTPEVRAVLDRAASESGMPLDDLTPELLAALRAAGVDGRLVVRRL